MAEIAVTYLLEKLMITLEEEVKVLKGVYGDVEFIKCELENMQAFLRDADEQGESDEGIKAWVKQVRDVAYDTEDILDEFMLCVAQRTQSLGVIGLLHKIANSVKHFKALHRFSNQILEIKGRILHISERRKRYSFNSQGQGLNASSTLSDMLRDNQGNALFIKEADLVGIETPRNDLINLLLGGDSKLGVVSVVGMGGIGKTTVVKKVYDDRRVMEYFRCHVWVTVSQSFKINDLLRDMILHLFIEALQQVPLGLEAMDTIHLKMVLAEFLEQKRYVIVFDDLWSFHAWEALKYALPACDCGSRIIITTRNNDLASTCIEPNGYVYNLQALPQVEAWDLFCRKAFWSYQNKTCPIELLGLSLSMLRRCEGLPLAIGAIGGLLATKNKSLIGWLTVHKTLSEQLESNDKLSGMMKILLLSYIDLPHRLKSCFLYLSIFPEDCVVERMKLIRLWIAEGFIEEKEGSRMEEVAENYLIELINRNLVQVAKTEIDGSLRSCQVHDILRDLIISKSREENFVTVLVQPSTSVLNENVRRLSIQKSEENVLHHKELSHLRSLFMFQIDVVPNSSVYTFTCGFKLLRVLDISGAPLEVFPSGIVDMVLLRYLSLRNTMIKTLPRSIGKLKNLETLDLKQTYVSELPVEILKLKKLRHLLVYRYEVESYIPFDSKRGFKAFSGIGTLVSLQKLSIVEANQSNSIVKELGSLRQLRRLAIVKLRREDGIDLCSSIEKMKHLRSLDVTSIDEEDILDLHSLSSIPPLLERLYMRGRLQSLPSWISSLHNLVILSLRWSRLKVNPLEALQDLPNLMELGLQQAYQGEELCIKGGFQKLKLLSLNNLENLKLVRVEDKALPNLQAICITRCKFLEKVPLGIERLIHLKELLFFDMDNRFCSRLLRNIGEDHWRIAHVPDVRFVYWTDRGWTYYQL